MRKFKRTVKYFLIAIPSTRKYYTNDNNYLYICTDCIHLTINLQSYGNYYALTPDNVQQMTNWMRTLDDSERRQKQFGYFLSKLRFIFQCELYKNIENNYIITLDKVKSYLYNKLFKSYVSSVFLFST